MKTKTNTQTQTQRGGHTTERGVFITPFNARDGGLSLICIEEDERRWRYENHVRPLLEKIARSKKKPTDGQLRELCNSADDIKLQRWALGQVKELKETTNNANANVNLLPRKKSRHQ